jgi:hypothetical protein
MIKAGGVLRKLILKYSFAEAAESGRDRCFFSSAQSIEMSQTMAFGG